MIVQRFLHWSDSASADERAEAISALARAYIRSDFSPDQRAEAEAAMTMLMDDAAPKVRLALADALGASNRSPRHIILGLSRDLPEIAMMVICRSPLFMDAELIDMVKNSPEIIQTAIACRQPLPANIGNAVCTFACQAACEALLQNDHVALPHEMLMELAKRFGQQAKFRQTLMQHPNLPADISQLLIQKLSEGLVHHVVGLGWMTKGRADRVALEACEKATLTLATSSNQPQVFRLVEHLRGSGQLTAAMLLRAICKGDISFFKAALSNLSGLPAQRVHAIIASGKPGNFRAAYNKTELPAFAYRLFEVALGCWREAYFDNSIPLEDMPKQVMDRIVERYQPQGDPDEEIVLVMLNRLAAEVNRDAARLQVEQLKAAA